MSASSLLQSQVALFHIKNKKKQQYQHHQQKQIKKQ